MDFRVPSTRKEKNNHYMLMDFHIFVVVSYVY